MYQCPYPGCNYVAAHLILNSHAKTHGYDTTAQLTKAHGRPILKYPENKVIKWASDETPLLSRYQYDGAESNAARLNKTDKKNR